MAESGEEGDRMSYKDPEKQKEAVRKAVEKHRVLHQGITKEGITTQGITYPPILHALIDPIKRKKLEAIYQSLRRHNKADKVFYGFPGLGGVPFNIVGDYLEVTRI